MSVFVFMCGRSRHVCVTICESVCVRACLVVCVRACVRVRYIERVGYGQADQPTVQLLPCDDGEQSGEEHHQVA